MSEQKRYKFAGLPPLFDERRDLRGIPPIWRGKTIFILCGGPSFDPVWAERLRRKNVIGCNDAYKLGGDVVNYCHFLDLSWWLEHREAAQGYTGTFTTCCRLVHDPNVWVLGARKKGVQIARPDVVGHNRNTGLSAINVAVLFGAAKIILLGMDMQAGGDGETHWYKRRRRANSSSLRMHRRFALEVAEDLELIGGIKVINASPESKIPYWPKMNPEEALDVV